MPRNARLSMLLLALSSLGGAAPINAQETGAARDAIEQDLPDEFYCGERKLGRLLFGDPPAGAAGQRAHTEFGDLAGNLELLRMGFSEYHAIGAPSAA